MLCVTFLSTRKRCFEYIFLLQLLHLVYVTFFSVFFFRFHAKQRAIIENNKNNERKTRKENETYHCEFLWMWLNPRVSRCRTENKISFRLHPVCGSKNVDVCVFLSQLLHLYLLRRFGVSAIVCFTLYSIFSSFLVCLSIYCLCCAVLCVSCHFVGLFFLFSVVIVDIHCLAGDSAGSCWKFLYRPCECVCSMLIFISGIVLLLHCCVVTFSVDMFDIGAHFPKISIRTNLVRCASHFVEIENFEQIPFVFPPRNTYFAELCELLCFCFSFFFFLCEMWSLFIPLSCSERNLYMFVDWKWC